MSTTITTTNPYLNGVLSELINTIELCRITHLGATGYRPNDSPTLWIRDSTLGMEGAKYFVDSATIKSAPEAFLTGPYTGPQGGLSDICDHRDYTVFAGAEADLLYLCVIGVWEAWKATGDDVWMNNMLSYIDSFMDVYYSHWARYNSTHGIIQRWHTTSFWDWMLRIPYCADWNGISPSELYYVGDPVGGECWVIYTGDVAGMYRAMNHMIEMYTASSLPNRDAMIVAYTSRKSTLKSKADELLWDSATGRFKFHHDLVLTENQVLPAALDFPGWTHDDHTRYGVSENATALIWGLAGETTSTQYQAALQSYKDWAVLWVDPNGVFDNNSVTTKIKYPWALFHPPMPTGVVGGPGPSIGMQPNLRPYDYCNGGLMPFVGARWALAAFEAGDCELGWNLLKDLITFYRSRNNTLGTSYWPDGSLDNVHSASESGDPWGIGPIIQCVIEGVMGIKSSGKTFESVSCFPKWNKINETVGNCRAEYPSSNTYFSYNLTWSDGAERCDGTFSGSGTSCSWKFIASPLVEYKVSIDGAEPITLLSDVSGIFTFNSAISLTDKTLSIYPTIDLTPNIQSFKMNCLSNVLNLSIADGGVIHAYVNGAVVSLTIDDSSPLRINTPEGVKGIALQ